MLTNNEMNAMQAIENGTFKKGGPMNIILANLVKKGLVNKKTCTFTKVGKNVYRANVAIANANEASKKVSKPKKEKTVSQMVDTVRENVAKEANRRERLSRPKEGTITGQIWDKLDALAKELGHTPSRKEALENIKGFNTTTISCQRRAWKIFYSRN